MRIIQSNLYNEKDKKEYIEFENKNPDALRRYFQRICEKENEYKKDIYEMSKEELMDTIISLNIRRSDSRSHFISLMRGYITWARLYEKIKTDSLPIDNITPEMISSHDIIKTQMLKNPEQLQEILNNNLDFIDYENRSKRDSLIFWLLYNGLDLEEIQILKKDNLNSKNKIITTKSGKTIEVDGKIFELWNYCSQMRYVEKKNSKAIYAARKFNTEEYTKLELVENDYLFRPPTRAKVTNDTIPLTSLRTCIYNLFQDESDDESSDIKISPSNIRNSGIFFKLYSLELNGTEITSKIIAKHFNIDYENTLELQLKTRKWRIDYDDWKNAFYSI